VKNKYLPHRGLLNDVLTERSPSIYLPSALGFFFNQAGELFLEGLAIIALAAIIRELRHQNKPLKVLGVTRVDGGKIRVDLENRSLREYYIKPCVRVAYFPTKEDKKELKEIPMLAASSKTQRKTYELLGEADKAVAVEPGQTTQVLIDCSHAKVELKKDTISVSVEYGEREDKLTKHMSKDVKVKKSKEHPYLRHVGKSRAFILKTDHHEVLCEAFMIEGLLSALENAPPQSIEFHMKNGNDFAKWVKEVVGDKKLAQVLYDIRFDNPESTRKRLVESLIGRIIDLEDEKFSGRHPNLEYVGEAYSFKLKLDHENIIDEAAFLEELRDLIRKSSSDAVVYHMQAGKNDFADWAHDVLGDEQLAEALRSVELISPVRTKDVLARVIDYRIKELERLI
jgi:hypothetical protein